MPTTRIAIKHRLPNVSLLTGLQWAQTTLPYDKLSTYLADKHPYTITIILDMLSPEFWNRKSHVDKTRHERMSRYHELVFQMFTHEFGADAADQQYRQWLDIYRKRWLDGGQTKSLDEYILEFELGPRYQKAIESRYKNRKKLYQPRFYIHRERQYHLPAPITQVDWRSPYDTLFIWTEKNQKFVARGGSGSSGARETNSRFIFALGLLNQKQPIVSHLFLYDKMNQLHRLQTFAQLAVPRSDIGSNYDLEHTLQKQILKGTQYIWWENYTELKKLFLNTEGTSTAFGASPDPMS